MSTYKPKGRVALEKKEIDYRHKLSAEEKAWLDQFDDETCQAYFSKHRPSLHVDQESRRKIYAECNAARRDIWHNALRAEGEPNQSTDPEADE